MNILIVKFYSMHDRVQANQANQAPLEVNTQNKCHNNVHRKKKPVFYF